MSDENSTKDTDKQEEPAKETVKSPGLWGWMKSVYKDYLATIWLTFPYVFLFLYPAITNLVNLAPPENKLQWISGKVIIAQRDHPNIRLEMTDGSTRDFDFFANLTGIVRGLPRFGGATNSELASLKGCQAELGVIPIKWLIFPHNDRIWSLRSKCFSLPYTDLITTCHRNLKLGFWIDVVAHISFVSFAACVFYFERRKKWAFQQD